MWRDREITERWPGKEGVEGGSGGEGEKEGVEKEAHFWTTSICFHKIF